MTSPFRHREYGSTVYLVATDPFLVWLDAVNAAFARIVGGDEPEWKRILEEELFYSIAARRLEQERDIWVQGLVEVIRLEQVGSHVGPFATDPSGHSPAWWEMLTLAERLSTSAGLRKRVTAEIERARGRVRAQPSRSSELELLLREELLEALDQSRSIPLEAAVAAEGRTAPPLAEGLDIVVGTGLDVAEARVSGEHAGDGYEVTAVLVERAHTSLGMDLALAIDEVEQPARRLSPVTPRLAWRLPPDVGKVTLRPRVPTPVHVRRTDLPCVLLVHTEGVFPISARALGLRDNGPEVVGWDGWPAGPTLEPLFQSWKDEGFATQAPVNNDWRRVRWRIAIQAPKAWEDESHLLTVSLEVAGRAAIHGGGISRIEEGAGMGSVAVCGSGSIDNRGVIGRAQQLDRKLTHLEGWLKSNPAVREFRFVGHEQTLAEAEALLHRFPTLASRIRLVPVARLGDLQEVMVAALEKIQASAAGVELHNRLETMLRAGEELANTTADLRGQIAALARIRARCADLAVVREDREGVRVSHRRAVETSSGWLLARAGRVWAVPTQGEPRATPSEIEETTVEGLGGSRDRLVLRYAAGSMVRVSAPGGATERRTVPDGAYRFAAGRTVLGWGERRVWRLDVSGPVPLALGVEGVLREIIAPLEGDGWDTIAVTDDAVVRVSNGRTRQVRVAWPDGSDPVRVAWSRRHDGSLVLLLCRGGRVARATLTTDAIQCTIDPQPLEGPGEIHPFLMEHGGGFIRQRPDGTVAIRTDAPRAGWRVAGSLSERLETVTPCSCRYQLLFVCVDGSAARVEPFLLEPVLGAVSGLPPAADPLSLPGIARWDVPADERVLSVDAVPTNPRAYEILEENGLAPTRLRALETALGRAVEPFAAVIASAGDSPERTSPTSLAVRVQRCLVRVPSADRELGAAFQDAVSRLMARLDVAPGQPPPGDIESVSEWVEERLTGARVMLREVMGEGG